MLPTRLQNLKSELEKGLHFNKDDNKALKLLQTLERNPEFLKRLTDGELLTKSFSVAPEKCPSCGKRL